MSFRSTALLFGMLVGMLWLFGLMLAYKKTAFEESYIVPSLQANQDAAIDAVTVERRGKESRDFRFVHADEHWTFDTGKTSIRMEDFRIEQIVRDIKNARRNEEAGVTDDPSLYGLDSPQTTVTLEGRIGPKKDEKKTWKLFLGKDSADKSLIYVSSSDRPSKVLAVAKASIDSLFFKDANYLRARQLFDFSDLAVKKVILKEGKKDVELKKGDDDTWRFVQPALGFAEAEGAPPAKTLPPPAKTETSGGVKGLITAIRNLKVDSEEDFVPPSETNLAEFGLDEGKESMRVQVATGDEKKVEALLIGKQAGKEHLYARMAGDQGMFKITSLQLDAVRKMLDNPGQLRSTDITPIDTKKVDQAKLTIGKDTIQLTGQADKSWQMQAGAQKATKADTKAVEAFLETVQGKREIRSYIEDAAAVKKLDAETPTAELTLFLTKEKKKDDKEAKDENKEDKKDEKKEDKKDTKPAVTLTFGAGDKDTVPVKRVADGTISHFTIPRTVADKIVPANGYLSFLDLALPAYATDEVTSLTLERGKDKTELVRGSGKNAQRWVFKDTAASAEPTLADADKLQFVFKSVLQLQAKKWLEKIDPKADLDKFGLKTPVLTVTVMVKKHALSPTGAASFLALLASPVQQQDLLASGAALASREADKGQPVVLRFGKDTDQDKDKPGTFAQHSGSELLFLVIPDLVRILKEIDLRDRSLLFAMEPLLDGGAVGLGPNGLMSRLSLLARTVQVFDPAKVKEVKLDVRTTELRKFHFVREAKDKAWQDQSGLMEFQLNPEKVNSLVEQMSKLHADRWIALAGNPRPDYKFDAKDATLKISFTMDDGQTITLTVGDSLDRLGHFAQTSAWPGAVFLLSHGRVEPYLQGTAYFGKDRVAER